MPQPSVSLHTLLENKYAPRNGTKVGRRMANEMQKCMTGEFPSAYSNARWAVNDHLENPQTNERTQWTAQGKQCSVYEIGGRFRSTEKIGNEEFGRPRTDSEL